MAFECMECGEEMERHGVAEHECGLPWPTIGAGTKFRTHGLGNEIDSVRSFQVIGQVIGAGDYECFLLAQNSDHCWGNKCEAVGSLRAITAEEMARLINWSRPLRADNIEIVRKVTNARHYVNGNVLRKKK